MIKSIKETLSKHEELVLKATYELCAIHDMDAAPTPELIEYLASNYNKVYARTTVVTFVSRMEEKGFVLTYRKGRTSYVKPTINRDEYTKTQLDELLNFWFASNKTKVMNIIWNEMSNHERTNWLKGK